ncbi:MAG: hypothetical protein HRU20_32600 [Pseudomonadales bacterium]|nr:hypothetical protein [Pseudomonadales bacterium]
MADQIEYLTIADIKNDVSDPLVVCSIPLKYFRGAIGRRMLPWIHRILKFPVHTFVNDQALAHLASESSTDGYWYCAGEFCPIDASGVDQYILDANGKFARCLVSPDIKLEEPQHPLEVIRGDYGISFVCHNIANRVMYASPDEKTLGDTKIFLPGYGFIIKGHLGVYGQNKSEWSRKVKRCSRGFGVDVVLSKEYNFRTQEEEINVLHLQATGNNQEQADTITEALREVDSKYYKKTMDHYRAYIDEVLDEAEFHNVMEATAYTLIEETEEILGVQFTQKIYGEYHKTQDIDLEPLVMV